MKKEILANYLVQTRRHLILILTCLIATAYAVLRYNVFQSVPWANLPLFIGNKAISFASVLLLAGGYLTQDRATGRYFGLAGFVAALLHTLMAFPLLTPQYYPTMYNGGRFSLSGELLLLTGVICFGCFSVAAVASLPGMQEALGFRRWLGWQRAGYAGLVFAGLHVAFRGAPGWFRPDTWPAWMPPITLLAFVAAILPLLGVCRSEISLNAQSAAA